MCCNNKRIMQCHDKINVPLCQTSNNHHNEVKCPLLPHIKPNRSHACGLPMVCALCCFCVRNCFQTSPIPKPQSERSELSSKTKDSVKL